MVDQFTQNLLRNLQHISLPAQDSTTSESLAFFWQGYDVYSGYQGERNTLLDALDYFAATNSRAHTLGGIALVLSAAAYHHAYVFDQLVMETALTWLSKTDPKRYRELGLVEATLYSKMKQFKKAQQVLNRIKHQGEPDYYLCQVVFHFWIYQGDLPRAEKWFQHGVNLATKPDQILWLRQWLAGFYLEHDLGKALAQYQELIKLNPTNAWLWHNMSIIFFDQNKLDLAAEHNQKALSLRDFGAARHMTQLIEKKRRKI